MGLNDLQLSPELLSQLYPASLIETEKNENRSKKGAGIVLPVPETTPPTPVSKYLGRNERNILIIVNYPELAHLPDEELAFLTSMLSACKLSLADVAIINRKNYSELSYKEILSHFQSRMVFLFGVDPLSFGLPVGFPPFQVQNVAACTFLFTPALEERHTDNLLKSKLWVSLRSIFGI